VSVWLHVTTNYLKLAGQSISGQPPLHDRGSVVEWVTCSIQPYMHAWVVSSLAASPSPPGRSRGHAAKWESLLTGLDYWTGLLDWTTGLTQNGTKCLLLPFSV